MTDSQPQFRYYKVEGEGFELLKAYSNELKLMAADRDRLAREFEERAQKQAESHHVNLRSIWFRLAASVGLDPEKTWGSAEYQIEARYLDEGFGALLYTPRHTNPMQQALEGQPIAPREDPETEVPDETETRH